MAINETLDVLNAVEISIDQLKAAMADGKIGFGDIHLLGAIVLAWKDGVVGISKVGDEIKNMSSEDLSTLFAKLAEIGVKITELAMTWPKA